MKLNAWAQFKYPFLFIVGINCPRGCQSRNHRARDVRFGEVPLRQCVIHWDAGETITLETLVRLTQCTWDVSSSHANAQNFFLCSGRHCGAYGKCRGQDGQSKWFADQAGNQRVLFHGISSNSVVKIVLTGCAANLILLDRSELSTSSWCEPT